MPRPEHRRPRPGASPEPEGPLPQGPIPIPPSPGGSKFPRRAPKPLARPATRPNTRRSTVPVEGTEGEEEAPEPKPKNPMILIGGIAGGVFLLIVIIAIAASGGSSAPVRRADTSSQARKPEPPPPPPSAPSSPRAYNYVINTGGIFFVCAGSDKHEDKEVIFSKCAGCGAANKFSWDDPSNTYKCASCNALVDQATIKCGECGKQGRKTHIKKVSSRPGE